MWLSSSFAFPSLRLFFSFSSVMEGDFFNRIRNIVFLETIDKANKSQSFISGNKVQKEKNTPRTFLIKNKSLFFPKQEEIRTRLISPSSAPPFVSRRRLWLVGPSNCHVITSPAAALGNRPRAGGRVLCPLWAGATAWTSENTRGHRCTWEGHMQIYAHAHVHMHGYTRRSLYIEIHTHTHRYIRRSLYIETHIKKRTCMGINGGAYIQKHADIPWIHTMEPIYRHPHT